MESLVKKLKEKRLSRLNELIEQLKTINESPKLYMSNFFDDIVNQIDVEAETILLNLNKTFHVSGQTKRRLRHLIIDDADDVIDGDKIAETVNATRQFLIDELKSIEKSYTTATTTSTNDDENLDDQTKRDNLAIWRRLSERLEDCMNRTRNNHHQKVSFDELNQLKFEIEQRLNELKQLYFKQKSFMFIRLPDSTNKLGALIKIDGEYLNDKEIHLLKRKLSGGDKKETIDERSLLESLSRIFYEFDDEIGFESERKELNLEKNTVLIYLILKSYSTKQLNFSIVSIDLNKEGESTSSLFDYFNQFKVEFERCQIERIDANAFNRVNKPFNLNLYYNRLRTFQLASDRMYDVLRLSLKRNQLEKLGKEKAFANFVRLEALNLNENFLTLNSSDDDDLFINLDQLRALELQKNEITAINEKLFRNNLKLSTLDLGANQIGSVHSDAFVNLKNLQMLNLNSNCLSSIDTNWFKSLSNSLTTLSMNDNRLEKICADDFKQLKNLKDLHLNSNNIEEIEKNSFLNLNYLIILNIQSNRLKRLDKFTVDGLSSLHTLDLSSNQIESIFFNDESAAGSGEFLNRVIIINLAQNLIESIEPNALKYFRNVNNFNLADNRLTKLYNGQFRELKMLHELRLSGNLLAEMNSKMFEGQTTLYQLTCDHNLIDELNELTFVHLGDCLKLLSLQHNLIRSIQKNAFFEMKKLKNLSLAFNRLRVLYDSIFAGINHNLTTLHLKNNLIEKIEPKAFDGLRHLMYLYLDWNHIRLTESNLRCFSDLVILNQLDLSNNSIDFIPEKCFKELKALEKLNLEQNLLTIISKNSFPDKLFTLNLSHNRIHLIQEDAFENIKDLAELLIFGNFLTNHNDEEDGTGEIFKRLRKLMKLDLKNNKYFWVPIMLFQNQLILKYLDLSQNLINDIQPEAFANSANLSSLFLNQNRISEITDRTFSYLLSVEHMELANNRIERIDANAFINNRIIGNLKLKNNKIARIEPPLKFNSLTLSFLDLSFNFIDDLAALVELNIQEKYDMSYCDLSGNRVERLNDGSDYSWLNNFKSIRLDCNNIKELRSGDGADTNLMRFLTDIESLSLCGNQLKNLENQHLFTNCAALERIYLADNFLKNLDSSLFNSSLNLRSKLTEIDLSFNLIEQIDPYLFYGLSHLKTLKLQSNRISNLSDGDLFRSLSELIWLSLSENRIESIEAVTFSHLRNIQTIKLENNQIRSIHPVAFKNLCKLNKLHLECNQIDNEAISPEHFKSCTNLENLHLEHNKLIKLDFLSSKMKRLRFLTLNNNQIDELPTSSFKNLNELEFLNLSSNYIKTIDDEGTFARSLIRIHSIDLSHNQLRELKRGQFECVQLRILNLSDNNIESLGADTFENLSCLESLDLSNNPIGNLNSSDHRLFSRLVKLRTLKLRNINLKKLNEQLLNTDAGLTRLHSLDLSVNQLKKLPDFAFRRLINLKVLNLSKNLIRKVQSARSFAGLSKLTDLDLSCNRIDDETFLNDDDGRSIFENLKSIQTLNLKENNLTNLNRKNLYFGQKIYLTMLDLSCNQISSIEQKLFADQSSLKSLQLNSNGLTHQIDPEWFQGLTFLNELNLSKNSFRTLEPNDFKHLVYLRSVDLSENQIESSLTGCILENLNHLESLDLHSNRIQSMKIAKQKNPPESSLKFLKRLDLSNNSLDDFSSILATMIDQFCYLENLNLTGNKLKMLDMNVLPSSSPPSMSCLTELSIENNSFEFQNQASLKDFLNFLGESLLLISIKTLRISINLNNDNNQAFDLNDALTTAMTNDPDKLFRLETFSFMLNSKTATDGSGPSRLSVRSSSFNALFNLRSLCFNGSVTNESSSVSLLHFINLNDEGDYEMKPDLKDELIKESREMFPSIDLSFHFVTDKHVRLKRHRSSNKSNDGLN